MWCLSRVLFEKQLRAKESVAVAQGAVLMPVAMQVDYVAGSGVFSVTNATAESICIFEGFGLTSGDVLALLQASRVEQAVAVMRTVASVTRSEKEKIQSANKQVPLPEGTFVIMVLKVVKLILTL